MIVEKEEYQPPQLAVNELETSKFINDNNPRI